MTKETLILKTFESIEKITNSRFVTLRNYDLIPDESSIENDIDLLIPLVYIQDLSNKLSEFNYDIYQDNNPCMYGAIPHVHFKHNQLDVHFDVTTGLYYRSIANKNIFINIDNKLTDKILNNKKSINTVFKYIPNPNDEIVHLVCHCIFDKNKTTERYEKKILELVDNINPTQVKQLLNLVFYKASDMIFNKILDKDVKNLFESYITFKDY